MLYRIHRLRTAAVRDSVEPPFSGSLAERMKRRDESDVATEVRTGWIRRDGDLIRWTVKGALWATLTYFRPGSGC